MKTILFAETGRLRACFCSTARQAVVLCMTLFFSLCVLWGCESEGDTEEKTVSGFAFDTAYSITVYEGGSQKILNDCVSKCSEYENIFSRTLEDSELYQINEIERLYGQFGDEQGIRDNRSEKNDMEFEIREDKSLACDISENMYDILERGIYYGRESDGAFDITIAPVTSLWDFTGENPSVPPEDELGEAVKRVDYQKISLEDGRVVFQEPSMALDLGGIAKGYIADALKDYLTENGVKSGMINLGGNVLCIGKKPDGKPFHIGVQQPFADRNETVAVVDVEDKSVVSSGIYERCFTGEDGRLYHHILNPKTGYSFDNELMAVTIISDKSVDGDGLSTSCFSMGLAEGMAYINSLDGVEALFITEDEKLHYSAGWEE